LIFSVGAVFSHSFAGSLSKGEVKILLSYPVKRWQLFLSKFITLLLVLFVVYSSVFSAQIYLYSLSPFEPLFYVSLLSLFFELLFMSAITVTVGLAVKYETISVLVSIILLYGINSLTTLLSPVYSTGRFRILFGYFGQLSHGELPSGFLTVPPIESVALAVAIPTIVSAALLALSLVYFSRVMEID
jgi:ABC-type transport system involved in multi-copper enzyme maturation permease subunit